MASIDRTRAVLEAAIAEFGEVRFVLDNMHGYDHMREDPTPFAGAWLPDSRTMMIDTRCGLDLDACISLLAEMVTQAAAERVDDFLVFEAGGAHE